MGRGFFGKDAIFFLLPPRETEEWRGRAAAAFGRRPWATIADGRRGKRSREARGADPQPRREWRWPVEAWPRQRAAAGGHGRGGAPAGLDGGRKLGETREGGEEALLRPLPWAEVARGGLATKAGGSGWRR